MNQWNPNSPILSRTSGYAFAGHIVGNRGLHTFNSPAEVGLLLRLGEEAYGALKARLIKFGWEPGMVAILDEIRRTTR